MDESQASVAMAFAKAAKAGASGLEMLFRVEAA